MSTIDKRPLTIEEVDRWDWPNIPATVRDRMLASLRERDELRLKLAAAEANALALRGHIEAMAEGVRVLWVEGIECLGKPDRCDAKRPCGICELTTARDAALETIAEAPGVRALTRHDDQTVSDVARWIRTGSGKTSGELQGALREREQAARGRAIADFVALARSEDSVLGKNDEACEALREFGLRVLSGVAWADNIKAAVVDAVLAEMVRR